MLESKQDIYGKINISNQLWFYTDLKGLWCFSPENWKSPQDRHQKQSSRSKQCRYNQPKNEQHPSISPRMNRIFQSSCTWCNFYFWNEDSFMLGTEIKLTLITRKLTSIDGLPRWFSGKESTCQCRRCKFDPLIRNLLEKEMATHFSILAWEIQWTEEPGGLQFMGLQIVGHSWATKHTQPL